MKTERSPPRKKENRSNIKTSKDVFFRARNRTRKEGQYEKETIRIESSETFEKSRLHLSGSTDVYQQPVIRRSSGAGTGKHRRCLYYQTGN